MLSSLLLHVVASGFQSPPTLTSNWKATEVVPDWLMKGASTTLSRALPLYRIVRITNDKLFAWDAEGMRDLGFETRLKTHFEGERRSVVPILFGKESRILIFRRGTSFETEEGDVKSSIGGVESNGYQTLDLPRVLSRDNRQYMYCVVPVEEGQEKLAVTASATVTCLIRDIKVGSGPTRDFHGYAFSASKEAITNPQDYSLTIVRNTSVKIRSNLVIETNANGLTFYPSIAKSMVHDGEVPVVDEQGTLLFRREELFSPMKSPEYAAFYNRYRRVGTQYVFGCSVRLEDVNLIDIGVSFDIKVKLDNIPAHPRTRPY